VLRKLLFVGALVAGVLVFVRRVSRKRERVDLFYEDGSFVTLGDEEARPLLDIARSALDATRA
jgi:hypothetical protein